MNQEVYCRLLILSFCTKCNYFDLSLCLHPTYYLYVPLEPPT